MNGCEKNIRCGEIIWSDDGEDVYCPNNVDILKCSRCGCDMPRTFCDSHRRGKNVYAEKYETRYMTCYGVYSGSRPPCKVTG